MGDELGTVVESDEGRGAPLDDQAVEGGGPVPWRGTRAMTQVMDAAGVRRIVVVSAAPVGTVASPARPHPPRRWMR